MPAVTRGVERDEPSSKLYVATGVSLAAVQRIGLIGSMHVESGQHLLGLLWTHEQLSLGKSGEIFGPEFVFTTARAGVALRTCSDSGIACIEGGLDLALLHERTDAMKIDEPTDMIFAVPRVAAEVGLPHVHVRPSVGMPLGSGVGLEVGLGLQVGW